jgi:hypothetical protein
MMNSAANKASVEVERLTEHVHFTLKPSDYLRISDARGHEPESSWCRRMILKALDEEEAKDRAD